MKFLNAAAIVAATIFISPATAIPIASETVNATTPGTVFETTNISTPKNQTTHYDTTNRRDIDTEGFPQGDWNNSAVSVVFYEVTGRLHVYNIDWAGDDGWMLYDELSESECPYTHWSYKWTGWENVKYEAKFNIRGLKENLVCTFDAIKRALDVDEIDWDQRF